MVCRYSQCVLRAHSLCRTEGAGFGEHPSPLIRLELLILDQPSSRYLFESFLNVAEDDQAGILAQLTGQDRLYLAFHGDDLSHRFTKMVQHDDLQRQQLAGLVRVAMVHWAEIPAKQRDFDSAKAEFMRWFV